MRGFFVFICFTYTYFFHTDTINITLGKRMILKRGQKGIMPDMKGLQSPTGLGKWYFLFQSQLEERLWNQKGKSKIYQMLDQKALLKSIRNNWSSVETIFLFQKNVSMQTIAFRDSSAFESGHPDLELIKLESKPVNHTSLLVFLFLVHSNKSKKSISNGTNSGTKLKFYFQSLIR